MGRTKNLFLIFLAIFVTALLLRRLLGAYGLVVPLLYMFFDVNWSLRVAWITLRKFVFNRKSNHNFLDVLETTFTVLPSDMDLNLHMNNARYPRECDFGRIQFWIDTGMIHTLRKSDCSATIAALTVRYRRSLELFQKVILQTKVLGWDEKAFYLEQKFLRQDGFVCAVVVTKNSVIQAKKSERFISPGELAQMLSGWSIQSPVLPQEVQYWIQYNNASSAAMKNAF